MNKIKLLMQNIFIIIFILMISNFTFATEVKVPNLTSPVMDTAKLLSQKERQILEDQIREIHSSNGPQIQILTVNDLQGFTIEEFSIRVAEKWQIGDKDLDNGIIITVAKVDRKVRIEVGNGIEGKLTDYRSSKIINRHMIPNFKSSNFAGGLQAAIDQISNIFNVNIKGTRIPHSYRKNSSNEAALIPIILLYILIFLFFEFFVKSLIKRFLALFVIGFALFYFVTNDVIYTVFITIVLIIWLSLNSWGRGSRSSGGGGWSGGGGGFSGGGSSGSW